MIGGWEVCYIIQKRIIFLCKKLDSDDLGLHPKLEELMWIDREILKLVEKNLEENKNDKSSTE